MPLFDRLRAADAIVSAAPLPVSPWSDGAIDKALVVAEAMGYTLSQLPMTRAAAMRIPAAARCRNLIVSAVSTLPLVALEDESRVVEQPPFLSRSDTLETPYDRMTWTVDDLYWHARSLWAVERDPKVGDAAYGVITDAVRVPIERWSIRVHEGVPTVFVQMSPDTAPEPVAADDVILFVHPSAGMLDTARTTLRAAEAIEAAYVDRAQNPIPITVIRYQQGASMKDELSDTEVQSLLDQWRTARRQPGGAVGYLPPQLVMETPGAEATDMLQEGRNGARIDIANHSNVPVHMIDGAVAEDSMTYRNGMNEMSRFVAVDLPFWFNAIEHRLSRDDVVPAGQRIRFDLAAYDTPAPPSTGVPTDD